MDDFVTRLEAMLAKGQDNAMLRLSLGKAYVEQSQFDRAATHLQAAIGFDANYSVAWKWLGKALQGQGNIEGARAAWQNGIDAAQVRGDQQIIKELQVFLRRLDRASA